MRRKKIAPRANVGQEMSGMDGDWVGQYILDEKGEPQPASGLTWAMWFENSGESRRIARTIVGSKTVSTVFLGLDYSFTPIENPLTYKPVLWETAVFETNEHCDIRNRYRSKQDALEGHNAVVEELTRDYVREHGEAAQRGH